MSVVLPPSPLSYEGQTTLPYISKPFAPPNGYMQAPVPCLWNDTSGQDAYIQVSPGVWVPIGGIPGQLNTLTGDDTTAITPTSNNITIDGTVVPNATHAKAVFTKEASSSTMSIDVQTAAAIASTDVTKVGLASFNNNAFSVDSNGFVSLLGGTEAVDSIAVDASTGPGTNPVLPTSAGLVTMTGAQVAAGTVGANVIRTNSLAANTLRAEIQRSAAVSSSASVNNGVVHFNSATSSVDSNGFMSPFQLAKFVVNPISGLGTHTTITAALAAASSGDYVLVTQGQYIENFTLPAGVTLSGMPGAENTPSTTVVGKITYTGTGIASISNLNLETNSDFCIVVSGSNASQLTLDSVNFQIANNTAISYTNSNSASEINIYNSSGDISTTGISLYSMSSTGTLFMFATFITNSGSSTTASSSSAGVVQMTDCQMLMPIATTSTATFGTQQSYFSFAQSLGTFNFNFAGSGQHSIFECGVGGTNATTAPITIGGSTTLFMLNSGVHSLNASWVTGTGTLDYAGVSVSPAGTVINAGLTANKFDLFSGNLKP